MGLRVCGPRYVSCSCLLFCALARSVQMWEAVKASACSAVRVCSKRPAVPVGCKRHLCSYSRLSSAWRRCGCQLMSLVSRSIRLCRPGLPLRSSLCAFVAHALVQFSSPVLSYWRRLASTVCLHFPTTVRCDRGCLSGRCAVCAQHRPPATDYGDSHVLACSCGQTCVCVFILPCVAVFVCLAVRGHLAHCFEGPPPSSFRCLHGCCRGASLRTLSCLRVLSRGGVCFPWRPHRAASACTTLLPNLLYAVRCPLAVDCASARATEYMRLRSYLAPCRFSWSASLTVRGHLARCFALCPPPCSRVSLCALSCLRVWARRLPSLRRCGAPVCAARAQALCKRGLPLRCAVVASLLAPRAFKLRAVGSCLA